MFQSVRLFAAFVVCCCIAQTADDSPTSLVSKKAQVIGDATVKGDYAKVVDSTYPKVVEIIGGQEKMVALIEKSMNQMKAQGFTLISFQAGEPKELLTEGDSTFAVVPTITKLTAPGGKLIARSYLLGVSSDSGKTWKFVDGAGLQQKEVRDKVLPKLPAKLLLPEKQTPEFIKDK
jgi:hypothetical protein